MAEQPEMTFEEALARLEQIVDQLDQGRLPLDEALQRFEEGAALKEFCEAKLKEAQAVIDTYLGVASEASGEEEGLLD